MRPDAVAHESLTNARALYNLLWRMVLRNSEDVLNGPGWVGFMSSVGSGERPGMLVRTPRGAGQPSKVTAASKLRGSVHLTGLIYGIQPVEGPRGLGCSSLGSFSCCCRSPTCLSAEAGGGEWAGWTEGLRPAGSGVGQAWARVRQEAVREAGLGRPGSRGHPPFRKTQPEVAGSATFHLTRPQHPPSGPRAVPALSAARAGSRPPPPSPSVRVACSPRPARFCLRGRKTCLISE